MLKTLFFGTPPTAVPFLERLAQKSQVIAVVTAPDKPVGRGYEITPPAVKKAAQALGLPVLQPDTLKGFAGELKKFGPSDLAVAVAYGKLIPADVFDLPRLKTVNVHFSLLPRYRGAGPVQWALIRGEKRSGVTLFRIEKSLDSGPIFLQDALDIAPEDNSLTLRGKLVTLGLEQLDRALARWEREAWEPTPQVGEPTLAPLLKKEDGLILWAEKTASEVNDLVRGTYEWPGAFSRTKGQVIKFRAGEPRPFDGGAPGETVSLEKGKGFLVKCRKDAFFALRVQPEGKKEMGAADFCNGIRLQAGDKFE